MSENNKKCHLSKEDEKIIEKRLKEMMSFGMHRSLSVIFAQDAKDNKEGII